MKIGGDTGLCDNPCLDLRFSLYLGAHIATSRVNEELCSIDCWDFGNVQQRGSHTILISVYFNVLCKLSLSYFISVWEKHDAKGFFIINFQSLILYDIIKSKEALSIDRANQSDIEINW